MLGRFVVSSLTRAAVTFAVVGSHGSLCGLAFAAEASPLSPNAPGPLPSFVIAGFPDVVTGATALDAPAVANRPSHDEYMVAWSGFAGASDRDIYAQKVEVSGAGPATLTTVCAAEGPQDRPAVAYSAVANAFWVAWQDGRSGRGTVIYARRLSPDGQPIGDEILVSDGGGSAVDVRAACGGDRCVFAWTAYDDGTGEILVRAFDPWGSPVSPAVPANAAGTAAWTPDLAFNTSSGRLLVVWAEWHDATATDLAGRMFDANLAPLGAPMTVYAGAGDQDHVRVDYCTPANRFLAVWEDYRSGTGSDVHARLLTGAGQPHGTSFPIYMGGGDDGSPAVVASSVASSFLVLLGTDRSDLMRPGQYPVLRACAVGASGVVTQPEEVRTDAMVRWSPVVAHRTGSDQFLAVWVDGLFDTDVMACPLSGNGEPDGSTFLVRPCRKGQQTPDAAYDPTRDGYLVVWRDFRSRTDYDIYARRVSAGGSPLAGEIVVASQGRLALTPTVAYNPTIDQFLVVWVELGSQQPGFGIYGQRLDGAGTLIGPPVLVSQYSGTGSQGGPSVAVNTLAGDYLVAWFAARGESWDICAQRLSANAALVGGLVWLTGAQTQGDPEVTYNPRENEYLVSWYEEQAAAVHARRLTAAGAPTGGSLLLLDSVAGTALHDVACDELAGGYLVVSTDWDGRILARLLDGEGKVSGDVPLFAEEGWRAQVRYLPRWRGYVIIWQAWGFESSWDVKGRCLSTSGAPLGARFVVADAPEMQDSPALALNTASGDALAVWEDFRAGNWDIYGMLLPPPPRSPVRRRLSGTGP